jgi:autotransporter adhesin
MKKTLVAVALLAVMSSAFTEEGHINDRLNALENAQGSSSGGIVTNTTNIANNTTSINEQELYSYANRTNIEQNTVEIHSLRSDLNSLDDKVNGIAASSAAFSQLVQPYGVGKVNVSVGLGFSKGAEAIAIGSGYRANEQLTFRGGVAYDSGSHNTTLGLGAGYEF